MTFSRREFLLASSALAVAATVLPGQAFAETADVSELMKPVPLGDMAEGKPDAPVTVIEYASFTCSHCAHFHETTYPEFKKKFIDTGKVYFIFREFPLDAVATAAAMLARTAPKDKYFDIVSTLFAEQRTWAFTKDPYNSLATFAKQIGFTQEAFDAALSNQKILDGIYAGREDAEKKFGVNATPTFFVNGEKHPGALTLDEMSDLIKAKS